MTFKEGDRVRDVTNFATAGETGTVVSTMGHEDQQLNPFSIRVKYDNPNAGPQTGHGRYSRHELELIEPHSDGGNVAAAAAAGV